MQNRSLYKIVGLILGVENEEQLCIFCKTMSKVSLTGTLGNKLSMSNKDRMSLFGLL